MDSDDRERDNDSRVKCRCGAELSTKGGCLSRHQRQSCPLRFADPKTVDLVGIGAVGIEKNVMEKRIRELEEENATLRRDVELVQVKEAILREVVENLFLCLRKSS
jgi:hypothetical protein